MAAKLKRAFQNQKLNIKFTLVIILFMMVPIGILAGVIFYLMEQNVIAENKDYMKYTMERSRDAVATKIDSINMTTQFFLSDEALLGMLEAAAKGTPVTTEEWLTFKSEKVSSLERLVYNNPLLYAVRVYAVNDSVQEMMPVLYRQSRMKKQEWAGKENYFGWNFDYTDNIFSSYTIRTFG